MSLNLVITMMDRDRRESMEAIFKSVGLPMSLTMLGRGTATMEHLSLNGLKATEKAVLSTVADSDKTRQLMLAAKVKMFIDIPGNGIMLSVPIKSVGGGKTLAYLTENQKSGGKPDMTFAHELIYVILNEGDGRCARGGRGGRHGAVRQGHGPGGGGKIPGHLAGRGKGGAADRRPRGGQGGHHAVDHRKDGAGHAVRGDLLLPARIAGGRPAPHRGIIKDIKRDAAWIRKQRPF